MSKKLSNLGNRNTSNIIDVLFAANILNIDFDQFSQQENQIDENNKLEQENKILK